MLFFDKMIINMPLNPLLIPTNKLDFTGTLWNHFPPTPQQFPHKTHKTSENPFWLFWDTFPIPLSILQLSKLFI